MRSLVLLLILCFGVVASPALAGEMVTSNGSPAQDEAPVQGPPNYKLWSYQHSSCQTCPLRIVPASHLETLQTPEARDFIHALEVHKADLLMLYSDYGVTSQDYNLLAQMAVGILGQESKFFQSVRYKGKETAVGQWALPYAKWVLSKLPPPYHRTLNVNSRGPTQIKILPKRIQSFYDFEVAQLGVPENAAIATMGFLIEALRTLRRIAINNNLTYIKPETYVDYLPYLYFGSKHQLIKQTATPAARLYIRNMKNYMSWTQVYEEVDGSDLQPLR